MTSPQLINLCQAWQEWAFSADQSEDGWQSDFPHWSELMSAACAAMIDDEARQTFFPQIELCWRISEETEDMADFAKEHVQDCWPVLVRLVHSEFPEVRWQVFAVLASGGRQAETLLRAGLNDPNTYCRRRALIALGQFGPKDALELKTRFLQDSDPGMRQAAASIKV
jgi:hypothetical protein